MARTLILFLAAATLVCGQNAPTGYTDTPLIPGTEWRIHDDARPRPPAMTLKEPERPIET